MQYGVPPRNLSVPIFLSKFLTDGMIHRLRRFSQIEKTPRLTSSEFARIRCVIRIRSRLFN